MNFNRGGQYMNQVGGGAPSPWASGAPPYNPQQAWNGQQQQQQPSPWMPPSQQAGGYGNQGYGMGGGGVASTMGMNNYGPPIGGSGYNSMPHQGYGAPPMNRSLPLNRNLGQGRPTFGNNMNKRPGGPFNGGPLNKRPMGGMGANRPGQGPRVGNVPQQKKPVVKPAAGVNTSASNNSNANNNKTPNKVAATGKPGNGQNKTTPGSKSGTPKITEAQKQKNLQQQQATLQAKTKAAEGLPKPSYKLAVPTAAQAKNLPPNQHVVAVSGFCCKLCEVFLKDLPAKNEHVNSDNHKVKVAAIEAEKAEAAKVAAEAKEAEAKIKAEAAEAIKAEGGSSADDTEKVEVSNEASEAETSEALTDGLLFMVSSAKSTQETSEETDGNASVTELANESSASTILNDSNVNGGVKSEPEASPAVSPTKTNRGGGAGGRGRGARGSHRGNRGRGARGGRGGRGG